MKFAWVPPYSLLPITEHHHDTISYAFCSLVVVLKLHSLNELRLAGDVEIVGAGLNARLHHLLAEEAVRPHAVQQDRRLQWYYSGGSTMTVTLLSSAYDTYLGGKGHEVGV